MFCTFSDTVFISDTTSLPLTVTLEAAFSVEFIVFSTTGRASSDMFLRYNMVPIATTAIIAHMTALFLPIIP